MTRCVSLSLVAVGSIAAVLVAGIGAIAGDAPNAGDGVGGFGMPLDQAKPSNIRGDERVIAFPTVARRSDDGERWVVPVHLWVFEPEDGDASRSLAMRALRRSLELENGDPANDVFTRRARWFLVDNERSKRLTIRIGDRAFDLPESTGSEGHLHATIELPGSMTGRVEFSVLLPAGDEREFTGVCRLLEPTGLTVISDIDDTVKVSHVLDKKKLLRKTFFEEFEPAPGMAAKYAKLADERDAAIVYVSSSPWQLQPEIAAMLDAAGFPPAAAYYLKAFRVKDSRFLDLFADPFEAKVARIESIIAAHPGRDYILIGDTGEKDPEVYAAIRDRHPKRVADIWIRAAPAPTPVNPHDPAVTEAHRKRFDDLIRPAPKQWGWIDAEGRGPIRLPPPD